MNGRYAHWSKTADPPPKPPKPPKPTKSIRPMQAIKSWLEALDPELRSAADGVVEQVVLYATRANLLHAAAASFQQQAEDDRLHRGAPIHELTQCLGLYLTQATVMRIQSGTQRSLNNFVRLLADATELCERIGLVRPRRAEHSARLKQLLLSVPEILWDVVDDRGAYRRAPDAVDHIWNVFARPAIAAERAEMKHEGNCLLRLREFCMRFSQDISRLHAAHRVDAFRLFHRVHAHTLHAAVLVISYDREWSNQPFAHLGVAQILDPNNLWWFEMHAVECAQICARLAKQRRLEAKFDDDHPAWSSITLFEDADAGQALLPPSTHPAFQTQGRISIGPPTGATVGNSTPVVRVCQLLRELVHRRFLILENISAHFVACIANAEYERYAEATQLAVASDLAPIGQRAGVHFQNEWLNQLPPATPMQFEPRSASEAAATETQCNPHHYPVVVRSVVPHVVDPQVVAQQLKVVPVPLKFDHCAVTMLIVAIVQSNCRENELAFCSALFSPRMPNICPTPPLPPTDDCIKKALASTFKLITAALVACGINAVYEVRRCVPSKTLFLLRDTPNDDVISRSIECLAALLRHFERQTPLPFDFAWHKSARTTRRHERHGRAGN